MLASLITLTTDFGLQDTYVAQMKGVIFGLNPQATIVDVTHAIEPQNIFQGAMSLDESFDAFPQGTIHIVVVDPGVGSSRKRIGVEIGTQRFVGPDNGLLSLLAKRQPIHRVHELTESRFHRQPVSSTFHGRDIFAPVAAKWSLGEDLCHFGPRVESTLVELFEPPITRGERQIDGQIIAIDRFGNLISDIKLADLPLHPNRANLMTEVAGQQISGLNQFYAEQPVGEMLVLMNSSGRIEISQNGGSAMQMLKAVVGTAIRVKW